MKKYLPLYYEWMETGRLPYRGLCSSVEVSGDSLLWLFDQGDGEYWGHEEGYTYEKLGYPTEMSKDVRYAFTPLRENIVLFLAAMNNRL